MKILIISSSEPNNSGVLAYDLNAGFKLKGHDSRILTLKYEDSVNDIYSMNNFIKINNILSHIFLKFKRKTLALINKIKGIEKNEDYYFFTTDERLQFFTSSNIIKRIKFKPDVILICFATGLLNSKNIYELNKKLNAPIFWYLMDMAAFTGGCHYAWNCKGYQKECGYCPGLMSGTLKDNSFYNHKYKTKYLKKTDITIVAGSQFQLQQVKKSSIFRGKALSKILLGIDPDIFCPIDKNQARQKLKLPANKKIIFFGAVSISEKRKGGSILLQALHKLKDLIAGTKIENDIHILIAGKNTELFFQNLCFDYTYAGFLTSKLDLASAYQSSDVFVSPSIEDSGPMMINQSIMCGTPVIAFDIGVAQDLIMNGETGYKVNIADSTELAQKICLLLEKPTKEHAVMIEKCRNIAVEMMHPDVQIRNFIKLFNR